MDTRVARTHSRAASGQPRAITRPDHRARTLRMSGSPVCAPTCAFAGRIEASARVLTPAANRSTPPAKLKTAVPRSAAPEISAHDTIISLLPHSTPCAIHWFHCRGARSTGRVTVFCGHDANFGVRATSSGFIRIPRTSRGGHAACAASRSIASRQAVPLASQTPGDRVRIRSSPSRADSNP